MAGSLRGQPPGRIGGRVPAGSAPQDHRRDGRAGGGEDPGRDAGRRHPLVGAIDGQGDRHVVHRDLQDLARVRTAAAPHGHLQALHRPPCSSTRSATSSGSTSIRPRPLSCCASTRSPRSRPSTAPSPSCPCDPGFPNEGPHDYSRHGTSTLFAALDVVSGKVIGQFHRRHRATEFRKFLETIDKAVPQELDLHLILDNYSTHKTPAIQKWLVRHPRFYLHFTPTYSSWLNLIERWFAELTEKWIRRGTHRSTLALESAIKQWLDTWNQAPRPFVWTKTADEILSTLASYLQRISGTEILAPRRCPSLVEPGGRWSGIAPVRM